MLVGVIGNIGAGKSTATQLFAERIGGVPMFEPVLNNPYLDDFYKDMAAYAFPLQVYFLKHRLANAIDATGGAGFTWLDRTVLEDRYIFAENLRRGGILTERDWNTYLGIYEVMTPHFGTPDLFVYLEATVDTLIKRIALRGRGYETTIPREYLADLNVLYGELASKLVEEGRHVVTIDMNQTDLTNDDDARPAIAKVREAAGAVMVAKTAAMRRAIAR